MVVRLFLAVVLAFCFFWLMRAVRQKIINRSAGEDARSRLKTRNKRQSSSKHRKKLVRDPKTGDYRPERDEKDDH